MIRYASATKVRMDRKASEICDPGTPVCDVEAHHPRAPAVDLDDEAAVAGRILRRVPDLDGEACRVARSATAEKGLDVFVIDELDEEVEILAPRPANGDHVVAHLNEDPQIAARAINITGWRRLTGVET